MIRQEDKTPFAITGPLQSQPTNFNKCLSNIKFKIALVTFLHEYWSSYNSLKPILPGYVKLYWTWKTIKFLTLLESHIVTTQQRYWRGME